jgi:hypothetical protein
LSARIPLSDTSTMSCRDAPGEMSTYLIVSTKRMDQSPRYACDGELPNGPCGSYACLWHPALVRAVSAQVDRKRRCRKLGEVARPAISILSKPNPKSETVDNFVAAQSL